MTKRASAVIIILAIILTGCGGDMESGKTVRLNEAEATLRKAMTEAASSVFPPGYQLTEFPPLPQNGTDPSGKKNGQKSMGLSFWVDKVDNTKYDTYLDAMKSWWEAHGWAPKTDKRPKDTFTNASRDEYGMSIQTTRTPEKRVSISGSTPWVWPNGTPEPQ